MAFPSLVLFPDEKLRALIPAQEWETCLKAWESGLQFYLSLSSQILDTTLAEEHSLLTTFLVSYMQQPLSGITTFNKRLRRLCFLLTHRILSKVETPPNTVLNLQFLGQFCMAYAHTINSSEMIDSIWTKLHLETRTESAKNKAVLITVLENPLTYGLEDADTFLRTMLALLKVSRNYGTFLMIGSDMFDSLIAAWENKPVQMQKKVTAIAYYSLISLVHGQKQNISLLLDHLYSLRASSSNIQLPSLLADLLTMTPFLRKLRQSIPETNSGRLGAMLLSLESIKTASSPTPKEQSQRRFPNHDRLNSIEVRGSIEDHNVHRASLVSRIQDLLPHLNTPLVLSLLDQHQDNADSVIAHLLDHSSSLPVTASHFQHL